MEMSFNPILRSVSVPISETWSRVVDVPKYFPKRMIYAVWHRHMAADREEETIIFFANRNDKQYYSPGVCMQSNNCL